MSSLPVNIFVSTSSSCSWAKKIFFLVAGLNGLRYAFTYVIFISNSFHWVSILNCFELQMRSWNLSSFIHNLPYANSSQYTSFGDAVVDEEGEFGPPFRIYLVFHHFNPFFCVFSEGAHRLFLVSLALCAIFVVSFLIELYGIIGVSIVGSFFYLNAKKF